MNQSIEITKLETLESQAEIYLETFKKAYWQFTQTLITIKDTGEWEHSGASTWESYLQARWLPHLSFKSTARIRQLESAYSTMQLIQDVTGVTLNEHQIRNLKSVVPDVDRHLLPEIVSRTHAYTSSPAKRHYAATYEVLLKRNQDATVTIDGESVAVDTTQVAVLEAVLESDKRQKEHIGSNGKWELVQKYEYKSAYDARQAFNELDTLQSLEAGMVIVVQIKRMKTESTDVNPVVAAIDAVTEQKRRKNVTPVTEVMEGDSTE